MRGRNRVLREAVQDFPQHRALIYDYAAMLSTAGRPKVAARLLASNWSATQRHHPDDLQARRLRETGKRLEQHQAQAYAMPWQGRLHAAVETTGTGQACRGKFLPDVTIESDLRELREMMGATQK